MTRKLYRSKKNRMISGVAGGIAEYFSIDPVIVRIIAIILLFISGVAPTVIIYVILWLIVPEQRVAEKKVAAKSKPSGTTAKRPAVKKKPATK